MMTARSLRRKFGGLDIVEKKKVKPDYEFLRWQAHDLLSEDIMLPAIYKLRAEVSATVTTRRLVAFGASVEELEQALNAIYYPPIEQEAA
jgi:hypothetical protein